MSYFFSFLIGAAVGSFINVLVLRLAPEKAEAEGTSLSKAVSGRSFCDSCKKTLRWFELIPVFSFIWQKGRCLRCRKRISWQYPIVELLAGIVFVLIFWKLVQFPFLKITLGSFGFYAFVFLWWLIASVMLAISVFDFKYYLIPDFLLYFLIGFGLILNIFYFFVKVSAFNTGPNFSGSLVYLLGSDTWFLRLGLGVVFAVVTIGLAYLMSFGKGMGFGDIILAFGLALVFGWPDILALMLFSFVIGTIASLTLIYLKKRTMKDIVPFAPFLGLGFMTLFLFGDKIVQAYLNLFPALFL